MGRAAHKEGREKNLPNPPNDNRPETYTPTHAHRCRESVKQTAERSVLAPRSLVVCCCVRAFVHRHSVASRTALMSSRELVVFLPSVISFLSSELYCAQVIDAATMELV